MTQAVLFDLDGTLADTAGDLAHALNCLRLEEGLEPLPAQSVRSVVSAGARGLLDVGFGITPQEPRYAELRERFLEHYARALCVHTRLFAGVPELLEMLESRAMPWGIVTNKATRFTEPLVALLGLDRRAACVVSGDTTERPKPAPDSLLFAANAIRVRPQDCLYIGDDLRDVQAARGAGMSVLAAGYGYLSGGNPHAWDADGVITHPLELLNYLSAPPSVG
jgi:phosphoglycolate phosphatase